MEARTHKMGSVLYGFRKVHIRVPYGSVRMTYRVGNTHMIFLRGCTEPASGLYEARESGLYEAREIPYEGLSYTHCPPAKTAMIFHY